MNSPRNDAGYVRVRIANVALSQEVAVSLVLEMDTQAFELIWRSSCKDFPVFSEVLVSSHECLQQQIGGMSMNLWEY